MSWGVATQNGVSVSLTSIVSLSAGVTEFSPADLFTGGTVGAWYDPSDYSTLFQDSAGTTPVTAVEQPVGLMLDKSQGLVLGSELVTNGDFSGGTTGWTAGNSAVFSVTSGVATIQNGAAAVGNANQSFTTVVGRWYVATATFSSPAGGSTGGQIYIGTSAGTFGVAFNSVATGTVSLRFAATATTTFISLVAGTATNGASIQADNVSVKELPGNHASQATAASRPVLRARYNQLTYSEQFDNAAWTKFRCTISQNATTAPDGTSTADATAQISGQTTIGVVSATTSGFIGSTPITIAVYGKLKEKTFFALGTDANNVAGSNSYSYFNLSTGAVSFTASGHTATISNAGNGWYLCIVTVTTRAAGGTVAVLFGGADTSNSTTVTDSGGIYIWGADLRTGSSAGTYQRIAAATDYATAGFLPYLYFVTDDSFSTGSINFTGTNKMSVCAGVTKLSDGGAGNYGCIAELSADVSANLGTFNLFGPASAPGGTPDFGFSSKGSLGAAAAATGNAAPVTRVLTGQGDIAADICVLRVNAANAATSSSDQGTGNFGNYPLYIGRRNNTLYPFNGNLYGLIVAGKALSASELSATEAWMAAKTGVTL